MFFLSLTFFKVCNNFNRWHSIYYNAPESTIWHCQDQKRSKKKNHTNAITMNLEDWIDRVKRVRDRNFIDELQVRASTYKFVREIRRKKSLPLLFFIFFVLCRIRNLLTWLHRTILNVLMFAMMSLQKVAFGTITF